MKYENRTFSYPVALSLMRGRTADAYREFFGHLAQIFEQKNHRPLRIPKILSDAEAAIFRPINEIFPNTTLKLCKVHFSTDQIVSELSQISINVYLAQLDIVEGFSGPVVMDRNHFMFIRKLIKKI